MPLHELQTIMAPGRGEGRVGAMPTFPCTEPSAWGRKRMASEWPCGLGSCGLAPVKGAPEAAVPGHCVLSYVLLKGPNARCASGSRVSLKIS